MTVTLKQVNQYTYCGHFGGVTGQPNFSGFNQFNRAVVVNPTTPVVFFNYYSTQNIPILSENGYSTVLGNYATYLYTVKSLSIWFDGYVFLGGTTNNTSCTQKVFYCSNANCSCSNLPSSLASILSGLIDIAINYDSGDVYLYHTASSSQAVIISIPIKELPPLLANLQFPSSYKVIYATPPNAPNGFSLVDGSMVFYNNTFYITGIDGNGNLYLWVFNLSQISFSNSLPNSPSSVGQLITIYNKGNANNGSLFLNTIVNNNTFTYEILLYFTVNTDAGNNLYIYSINTSTLTATLLFELQNVQVSQRAIYVNGLIAWVTYLGNNQYAVSVYDRTTQSYEQTNVSIPSVPCGAGYINGVFISEPYYVVVLQVGTIGFVQYQITTYQILTDVTPQIQNLQYSNGYITGKVINLTNNEPLSGVTVYLILLDTQGDNYVAGQIIASATTDSNGDFSIPVTMGGYMAVYIAQ